jgi:hypothetical protein
MIWSQVGRSPRMTAARQSDAAGWSSSISDDKTAGSLGMDEAISSQPAVWLIKASSASQPMAGHSGCTARPPKITPKASEASADPAVASATGPATCAEPVEARRKMSRNPA